MGDQKKLAINLFKSSVIIGSILFIVIISAYWPSLNGPLVFDDQLNIIENPGVAIKDLSFQSLKQTFLSNESGRLKRVLPALSFGINHYFAQGFNNTAVFKLTNLVIHLINTALVFWLAYLLWPRLFNRSNSVASKKNLVLVAACIALVWALHPLQLTPVVYVVQRMASMAGMFMLLGLCVFVVGRLRVEQGAYNGLVYMWLGIVLGTILGLMCKENAALLPLYAGVIEYTLFKRCGEDKTRKYLTIFYSLTVFIPVTAGLIYCFIYPGNILNGFSGRPFSLIERLWTEARVLWFYLYMLIVPDITTMGLFHDDLPISKGWLTPWTTIVSVSAWVITLASALLLRKKIPAFSFAVLWYLAGHSMESTFIPLKIIYEHRNYVPDIGPVFFVIFLSYKVLSSIPIRKQSVRNTFVSVLVGVVVLGLYIATHTRAEYWRTEHEFIASIAKNHPLSPSSQYLYGEVLYKKVRNPFQAYPYYFKAAQLEPDEVGFLISLAMVTPVELLAQFKRNNTSQLVDTEHIARMLKEKPVSAWGLRALEVAGRCIKTAHISCKEHVQVARSWLRAAIENKAIAKNPKIHFTNMLFDIEMKYGFYNEALNTVTNAKSKDKGIYRHELMLADVLVAKKQYLEAIEVLEKAEERFGGKNIKISENLIRLKKAVMRLVFPKKIQ